MHIGLAVSLFALEPEDDSGIAIHYRLLADELAAMGHRVHVIFATAEPGRARRALDGLTPGWSIDIIDASLPGFVERRLGDGWPRRALFQHVRAMWRLNRPIAAAVRRHRLQILETHTFGAPSLPYLLRWRRVKVASRVCTTMGQVRALTAMKSRALAWLDFLETLATKRSDVIVTHTRRHRDEICSLIGLSPSRMALVPLGVRAQPVQDAAATPGARANVLFIGRFESRKGIDVLLKAIPAVLNQEPDVDFILAGSSGGSQEWRDFLALHPDLCGGRVRATGRVSREELDRLLAGCTLFAAPSRYESFGLIYIEAMSHGKAVVGCRAGGIPEVVTDGVTGLLAEPGDADGLASMIVSLLRDPQRRNEMGRAGLRDFEARFTARRMAEASAALYARVLGNEDGA